MYDYTAGKLDWLAAGQPSEGRGPSASRVISAVVEVPTCRLADVAGAAAARAVKAGWPLCAVINEGGVVAGRLVADAVRAHDQRRVADAMEPGPKTIRAHEDLVAMRARLSRLPVPVLFVTTPEGMLLGALR